MKIKLNFNVHLVESEKKYKINNSQMNDWLMMKINP
jgi:hypothetical protein